MTRGRVSCLKELLDSINSNAKNASDIEVWVGAHPSDKDTVDFINGFQDSYDFKINTHYVPIPNVDIGGLPPLINRHRDILHPMVEKSKGKYLWILNDDVEIQTKNFDTVIENEIEHFLAKKSDRIFYGKCNETFRIKKRGWLEKKYHNMDYACYPLMTRETAEALGFFLPLEIAKSGADIALASILKGSVYDRFCDIPVTIYDKIFKGCTHIAIVADSEGEVSLTKKDINRYSSRLSKNSNQVYEECSRPVDVTVNVIYECKGCKQKNPINIFGTPNKSDFYTCSYCHESLFVGLFPDELTNFVRSHVDSLRYNLVINPYYIPDSDYHEP